MVKTQQQRAEDTTHAIRTMTKTVVTGLSVHRRAPKLAYAGISSLLTTGWHRHEVVGADDG